MTDYDMLLRDHVTLTCRSIDRLFLQAYLPQLQSTGQVCRFAAELGIRSQDAYTPTWNVDNVFDVYVLLHD